MTRSPGARKRGRADASQGGASGRHAIRHPPDRGGFPLAARRGRRRAAGVEAAVRISVRGAAETAAVFRAESAGRRGKGHRRIGTPTCRKQGKRVRLRKKPLWGGAHAKPQGGRRCRPPGPQTPGAKGSAWSRPFSPDCGRGAGKAARRGAFLTSGRVASRPERCYAEEKTGRICLTRGEFGMSETTPGKAQRSGHRAQEPGHGFHLLRAGVRRAEKPDRRAGVSPRPGGRDQSGDRVRSPAVSPAAPPPFLKTSVPRCGTSTSAA
jgi:hypothetical protein